MNASSRAKAQARGMVALGLFGVGGSFTLSPPLHALPPRLRCPLIRDSPGAARSTATGTAESSAGAPDVCGSVHSLHRYPVKSCGGENLSEVTLSRFAPLPGDRSYMWVDENGKFLTQRPREPRQGNGGKGLPLLATIQASLSPDGTALRLKADGLEPLVIDATRESATARRKCTLFSGHASVVDVEQPAVASEWFARFCGVEGGCLVRSDPEAVTLKDDWRESRVLFQQEAFKGEDDVSRPIPLDDGGCILIASQSSVDELNDKLRDAAMPEVDMKRFRPNIVIGGCDAHEEDEWLVVQIGEVKFQVERPCTRCSTVLVDQEKGESDQVNWLSKVLAKYRLSKPDRSFGDRDLTGTKFGVYVTPLNSGTIRLNDQVEVLQRK